MCFVKKEENTDHLTYHTCSNFPYCCSSPEYQYNVFPPFYNPRFIPSPPRVQSTPLENPRSSQLQTILNSIRSGNQTILSTLEVLEENENHLTSALNDIKEIEEDARRKMAEDDTNNYISENDLVPFKSSSPIIRKIFGNQLYKYKIKTASEFPKIIYKCRNIHIPVQLTTRKGNIVRNGNLMHLCLAVCNENGKWIQGEDGEAFIKGKIQIDLFRGEAEFKKIFPRDISRCFPGGKLNIVIYPRASLLTQSQVGKGEHLIDSSEVEPLLIHNILIKSKKKPRGRE